MREAGKDLREDGVEVAFKRVAHEGGVRVAVPLEEVDEICGHVAQVIHRAGHVLYNHGGADLPRPSDDRKQALAVLPENVAFLTRPRTLSLIITP